MASFQGEKMELISKEFCKDTMALGCRHTLGLKSDGTVIAVGDNKYGQCDVSGWHDVRRPGNR